MAVRSAASAPTAYQGQGYRALLQELKTAKDGGTTLITLAGAPRSAMRAVAQEIAGSLGRTVYRVDLSQVVSKYIGETEKNLNALFGKADAANWVLYFDEADSLFGKRSDVKDSHDRYANSETNQAADSLAGFRGVIVAALTHPGPQITTKGRVRHVRVKYPPE